MSQIVSGARASIAAKEASTDFVCAHPAPHPPDTVVFEGEILGLHYLI